MQVAVGLPATIPGTDGRLIPQWARLAEKGPFSALGVLDRVVYDNFEPMTALAAAAAVTERILLATSIVIAPIRQPALLAKQAASIQSLSGGRLVLGVGLGAREDDYQATDTPYSTRGRRLTDMLVEMRAVWEDGCVGPHGERPVLLAGGSGGLAASRMARYADGYVHNGGPPRAFARVAAEARAAWEDFGRPGKPQLWGMSYFQLGGDAEIGREYLSNYYAFTGPFADRIAAGLLTASGEIEEQIAGYAEVGCDHLILFPTVSEIGQLDRLADVITARVPA
jgi:alkanesulfonate monooxygenase SsuD/methylene tetrahydromethanopterin reductase-like flavin-dependent oxidoreductase (luciferase family)